MEDDSEIYDGERAQFPLSFGKQSKSQTPLELIHNTTRRPSKPCLESSKPSPIPHSRDDDATVGPPRPEIGSDDAGGEEIIGPPRPPPGGAGLSDDEEEMIGPPLPPPGSNLGSDEEEEDGGVENRYRIPMSNEIVLKGHTKAAPLLEKKSDDKGGVELLVK